MIHGSWVMNKRNLRFVRSSIKQQKFEKLENSTVLKYKFEGPLTLVVMRLIWVESDSNGLLKISSSRIHLVIITFTQFENRFGGRIKILIWFDGNTLKCSKTDVPNNSEYMNRGREIIIEPNRPNHTKLLWWYFAWNKI